MVKRRARRPRRHRRGHLGLDRHPAGRLLQARPRSWASMESIIGSRLIGQQAAVEAVADAVRRFGPASPTPTGRPVVPLPRPHRCRQDRTGQVARRLPFDDERAMVASTCRNTPSGTRWLASSARRPANVGEEEGGQAHSEAVRRRPVLPLPSSPTRIEKAHPETFDIPAAGAGRRRLTDGQGGPSTRNVILVLGRPTRLAIPSTRHSARKAKPSCRPCGLRAGILNRFDEVVIFDALHPGGVDPHRRPSGARQGHAPARLADHARRHRGRGEGVAGADWLRPGLWRRPLRRLAEGDRGPLARGVLGPGPRRRTQ